MLPDNICAELSSDAVALFFGGLPGEDVCKLILAHPLAIIRNRYHGMVLFQERPYADLTAKLCRLCPVLDKIRKYVRQSGLVIG